MARSTKSDKGDASTQLFSSFQYGSAGRVNIPEATETQSGLSKGKKQLYLYSPHLSPTLRFDETGQWDRVLVLIEKAAAGQKLTPGECAILRAVGAQGYQPWLEWAGKREQQARNFFAVDDVVLHIHERISAQAILGAARRVEDFEQDLFARPKLHREQALQYYRHSMEWANRLVLGDSLQVMSSLARRESLSGKVQMVFMDPPYGIKFSSNWQNEVGKRDVKEKEEDLTREPEMIRAYRDTWTLGVHSYLTYLKQRLVVARDLLTSSGSIFVQISDENLHHVRAVMDEVFGAENFCAIIAFVKTSGVTQRFLPDRFDHLIWYAKDKPNAKYIQPYAPKGADDAAATNYNWVELPDGVRRGLSKQEKEAKQEVTRTASIYKPDNITSQGNPVLPFEHQGKTYAQGWKTNIEGMSRLSKAGRLHVAENSLQYVRYLTDFAAAPLTKLWTDTQTGNFTDEKLYVVQTGTKTIERCILMTTEPGDLVLDPTCGSGTTAFAAEQWGRRWITIDSSRVAVAIARQRLLTACYDGYRTKDPASGIDPSAPQNPGYGLVYKRVPHITLKSIAQNRNLDAIFQKHEPLVAGKLAEVNTALLMALADKKLIPASIEKLRSKIGSDGARAVTTADLMRWLLPTTDTALIDFGTVSQRKYWKSVIPVGKSWQAWEVPFDADKDWLPMLQNAVIAFRTTWKARMSEINQVIELNAEQEDLVDQPEVVRGVSRVSGPFTVEGVRPEELALGEDGKVFDPTSNSSEDIGSSNADGYIDLMIGLLRKDGVTFLANRRMEFANLVKEAGRGFHARGRWKDKGDDLDNVAVFFGPQYGPVNAPMMREAIEGAQGLKEVDELVVAGFSFDSAAQEVAKEKSSDNVRIHLAHIRPDVSPGMQGLLKETANSQLFTVFGQPDIAVADAPEGMKQVKMNGVCIYNPLTGEISEAPSNKVAAWFLDADYDGRCFCVSQAFFPDKEAWAKIAKALGSSVGVGAFEDFTVSWPFKLGKHKRIAVKVIDPRGNEVMAIKTLNA